MKNSIFILVLSLAFVSCKKEVIEPNEKSNETIEQIRDSTNQVDVNDYKKEFVKISFNDIFEGNVDSVYIFRNDVFLKTIAVGCGNVFSAELNFKYSFKKKTKKNNSLVNLYGLNTSPETYLTFLTTSMNPVNCIDFIQEGLMIMTIVINDKDKCESVNYTLNTWL